MQLPQIRLQTQVARIGLKSHDAQLQIDSGPAKQSIRQPKADIQIRTTPSKLTIDQSKALADVGLKPITELNAEFAQEGKQKLLEGIARRRRQGDELMKIEDGGNPIVRQVKENSQDPQRQFNIGWIPSANGVKIDYRPAEVNIKVTPQKPQIETQPTKTQYQYQSGNVEVYLLQKSWLEIDFVNLKHVGINFEMEI
ncbi:DUF6470 family protein [Gracilibacillus sp. D59]|uniref:DUF6470 family protein n=1 Tax=Gracilibacillus sp. D59 TaxID=3457434 RepID=UPI003FCE331B